MQIVELQMYNIFLLGNYFIVFCIIHICKEIFLTVDSWRLDLDISAIVMTIYDTNSDIRSKYRSKDFMCLATIFVLGILYINLVNKI